MRRTSVAIPEGVDELVDGLVAESGATRDVPSLTQSDVLRLLLRDAAERLVDGDLRVSEETREVYPELDGEALRSLIPEHKRARFLYDERKDRNWLNDMRGGFEGRVLDRLSERFGGAGYSPEEVEDLAREYIGEARDLWLTVGDDPETFREKKRFVLAAVEKYKSKYQASEYDALDEFLSGFDGVVEAESVEEFGAVEGDIRAVASARFSGSSSPSADALAESLAFAFGVDEEPVREVVDEVRRESMIRDQQRGGDGEDLVLDDGGNAHDAHARAPDADREEPEEVDAVEVTEEEVRELYGEDASDDDTPEIMTDGGRDPEDFSPGQEGYWNALDERVEDPYEDDEDDRDTVRDRLVDQLDGTIHGVAATAVRDRTTYLVVAHDSENRGLPVVCLSTVVVDLGAETVKVNGDNSMWVPREAETLDSLTRVVARTTSDVSSGVDDEPVFTGVDEVEVEDLLATAVEDEAPEPEDDEDLSPAQGEPPREVDEVVDRLDAVGVDTSERFIRLDFGEKSPWSHTRGDRDYLLENYGVYATSEDSLVIIDIDDPEEFDADLPPTFTVSSPHGGDDRSHYYLSLDDEDGKEALREAFGTYNLAPSWGDVQVANRYVVGPGSVLDGCDKDGCDECHRPDGGKYEVVDDSGVAEVSAEFLIDLLSDDDEVEREEPSGGEAPVLTSDGGEDDAADEVDSESDESDESVECVRCGSDLDRDDASLLASDGEREAFVCRGGCE